MSNEARHEDRGYQKMSTTASVELLEDEAASLEALEASRQSMSRCSISTEKPNTYEEDFEIPEIEMDLCFARATIGVTMREEGIVRIEESVYGAAILMPQLARTVKWNKTMSMLALQSWMFLVLNVVLQAYLLKMLAKEEIIMDGFAGQMFLCDFGSDLEKCPGPGCRGPLGTQVTGPRLYSWDAIVDRTFVRDSFKALFPDRMEEIDQKIDPGEYGVESYWCRFACCFVFMISCMDELTTIYKMAQLLYKIPTEAGCWLRPRPNIGVRLVGDMEETEVKIAGMPMFWKLVNLMAIVVPKVVLWKLTAETGMGMLMDTSGIDDIITNSVALTFILGIDELMAEALMSEEALNFLMATEDFPLYDEHTSCVGDTTGMSDHEILAKYREVQFGILGFRLSDCFHLLPAKLVMCVLGTSYFVWEYYHKHCVSNPDDAGRFVSRPMAVPKSMAFTWMNALFPQFFPIDRGDQFWEMPKG